MTSFVSIVIKMNNLRFMLAMSFQKCFTTMVRQAVKENSENAEALQLIESSLDLHTYILINVGGIDRQRYSCPVVLERPLSILLIEILGAKLEGACMKKGEFFQLIATIFYAVKRGFPSKSCKISMILVLDQLSRTTSERPESIHCFVHCVTQSKVWNRTFS